MHEKPPFPTVGHPLPQKLSHLMQSRADFSPSFHYCRTDALSAGNSFFSGQPFTNCVRCGAGLRSLLQWACLRRFCARSFAFSIGSVSCASVSSVFARQTFLSGDLLLSLPSIGQFRQIHDLDAIKQSRYVKRSISTFFNQRRKSSSYVGRTPGKHYMLLQKK